MPRGRPKTIHNPRQLNILLPAEDYDALQAMAGGGPRYSFANLVRDLLRRAIEEHRQSPEQRTAMQRLAEQRERQIRRLAVACASAPDARRAEKHARRLAVLMEEPS